MIIDEAQDLSPLQIEAIRPTLEAVRVALVAGDDDQAIFTFQGAEPDWLLELARDSAWQTEVLPRSYRVPRRVHAVAQRIILRNHHRVPKNYASRPDDGLVRHDCNGIVDLLSNSGPTAFLARTRRGTVELARELYQRRTVPYLIQRGFGPNPLGDAAVIDAVNTAWAFCHGDVVSLEALIAMLEYVPSRHPLGLLTYRTKENVKSWEAPMVSPDEIDLLGLGRLRDHGRATHHCEILMKLEAEHQGWLRAIWGRHGKLPKPDVILSTIHGSKGAEWPTVIVCPDHPKTVQQTFLSGRDAEREAENRVAYVAVTRAKERLYVARQESRFGYPYPT